MTIKHALHNSVSLKLKLTLRKVAQTKKKAGYRRRCQITHVGNPFIASRNPVYLSWYRWSGNINRQGRAHDTPAKWKYTWTRSNMFSQRDDAERYIIDATSPKNALYSWSARTRLRTIKLRCKSRERERGFYFWCLDFIAPSG